MNGFDPTNLRYEKTKIDSPTVSSYSVCKTDISEGKCGPFAGSHTYEFSSTYVKDVKNTYRHGKRFKLQEHRNFFRVDRRVLEPIKEVQAKSSHNGEEFASAEYTVPINKTIEGFKIFDGCACCIDKSEIWLNTYQSGPKQANVELDTENTVTLRHWDGEGSYEEGYDLSEKGIQRHGETGPDKPSLDPDLYYLGSWERSFPDNTGSRWPQSSREN